MEFLECVLGNGFDTEMKWISKFREMGHELVNGDNGGPGNYGGYTYTKGPCSEEHKKKLSDFWKPMGLNPGLVKAAEARTGKKQSPEQVAKRVYARNVEGAYRPSEEAKRKCRESNIKTWSDPELREKHKAFGRAGAAKQWAEMTPEKLKDRADKLRATRRDKRAGSI